MTVNDQKSNTFMGVTEDNLEKHAQEIIQGTACTLRHIQDVNDWNGKPQSMTFVGKDVPDLPLLQYCERLQKYFRCSPACYLSALIYIDRFINNSDVTINRLTIHRLVAVSFIIAVKYYEDLHFSNSYYSQVVGIDLKEVNKLEAFMLNALNFDLSIKADQFEQYFSELALHPQLCPTCRGEPAPDAPQKSSTHFENHKDSGKPADMEDCDKGDNKEMEVSKGCGNKMELDRGGTCGMIFSPGIA